MSQNDFKDVPNNLAECFTELNRIFTRDQIKHFKAVAEDELGKYHFGLGLSIRNTWGLWAGSQLAKYFNDIGVFHPDDMSAIIILSYHRYLNGADIRLDEQIQFYQNYWADH